MLILLFIDSVSFFCLSCRMHVILFQIHVVKLSIVLTLSIYEPGHEKMCLMSYANNKGADQPAHQRSLISAFWCSLLRKYNISRFYSQNFKALDSFCGCAGQFVSSMVGNS